MNTLDEIKNAAVELLHFHTKWFDYEMLPLGFFEQQMQKYRKVLYYQEQDDAFWENPDPQVDEDLFWASLEHHRYAAFNVFLSSHPQLSDEQLRQYVELCALDEDQLMAPAALINLIQRDNLTEMQRQYLLAHPACQTPRVQPFTERLK